MKKTILAMAITTLVNTPVFAAHNNPWADTTDTLLAKNHDDNQEQSVGTPGQDEMRGDMAQKGAGNTGGGFGGAAPADGSGHMGGGSHGGGGQGGGGHGGAGNGGGGHGGGGHGGGDGHGGGSRG